MGREERAVSLRERLVEAGVQLVMTEGTASLGLREIARRAGVSHGAPRRYFPTHQALLSAIARRGFADLASRLAPALSAPASARARLRALARVYVGYALTHRRMFELMFRHDLLNSERAPEAPEAPQSPAAPQLREVTLPLFAQLVDLVDKDHAERPASGAEQLPDAAATAAALWANLHGIAQLWTWGSLQLALGEEQLDQPAADASAPDLPAALDRMITAALDAHLGRVAP
ncbi:TetR/AcrR family transcriptional regulator [Streptomyces triticagri]|uniref:TetR/AcrR family transcriptional regulator n=1 Tax=Streptomyces triticagri TaxID=2293568 RepID=A0A372MBC7_9ACTN|nr:TetR/AcrR family transcriptional regulator [Streptomyces triticagri]RFU88254.1 TetR/AcrR family transcriptional regulator [Streptomyces triticagri]